MLKLYFYFLQLLKIQSCEMLDLKAGTFIFGKCRSAENGHFLAFSAENGYIFGTNFCIIFRTFAHKNELCVSMFTECEVPVLQYLHTAHQRYRRL